MSPEMAANGIRMTYRNVSQKWRCRTD